MLPCFQMNSPSDEKKAALETIFSLNRATKALWGTPIPKESSAPAQKKKKKRKVAQYQRAKKRKTQTFSSGETFLGKVVDDSPKITFGSRKKMQKLVGTFCIDPNLPALRLPLGHLSNAPSGTFISFAFLLHHILVSPNEKKPGKLHITAVQEPEEKKGPQDL